MYLDYFSLREKPFSITPDPRFLFLSGNHKEVFAHLLFGIRSRCGFIEVTGEVGTGKTTVLRTLLNQLGDEGYPLAFIFNPSLSSLELLRAINREFGIAADGSTSEELLNVLYGFLLRENAAGRTVVLVIDEAQNLAPQVLEQIRLLSNLETERDKLIQIVLVGQPELGEILARSELRQLSQRIAVRYHLEAMNAADTRAYVSHRLTVSGKREALFTPAAIRKIYRHSGGVPRLINILCDRALLIGYADGHRRIGVAGVRKALSELRRQRCRRRTVVRRFWPALAMISLVFAGLGYYVGTLEIPNRAGVETAAPAASATSLSASGGALLPEASAEPAAAAAPTAPLAETGPQASSAPTSRLPMLKDRLGDLEEGPNLRQAVTALQGRWDLKDSGGRSPLAGLREVHRLMRGAGLHLARFQGSLGSLLKLDAPALLEVLLPGVEGRRYLALVGVGGERAEVVPELNGAEGVGLSELERLWSGRAWVPWKNYRKIPPLAVPGSKGEGVARLQELMHQAGAYDGPGNGIYDRGTIGAVTRFQASRGLVQDGRVGPRTLMLLYQAAGSYGAPRISVADGGGGS